MIDYLDGLLHADYLTYWDYVHLDTLLSLQTPKTSIPDEPIFIMYHQITELYFKSSLCTNSNKSLRLGRGKPIQYWKKCSGSTMPGALTHSFSVMEKGMDRRQFLDFRMSLIPASGFSRHNTG